MWHALRRGGERCLRGCSWEAETLIEFGTLDRGHCDSCVRSELPLYMYTKRRQLINFEVL
jgi:hypothetical protein